MYFLPIKEEIKSAVFFFVFPDNFIKTRRGRMANRMKKATNASRGKERERKDRFLGSVGIVKIQIPQKKDIKDTKRQ
jgi:hypothetical protein